MVSMAIGSHRPTRIIVNLDAIKQNIQHEREQLKDNQEIYAVVKANGYGHGAEAVSKAALEAGATGLCVAILDEAIALRKSGIEAPILVLGVTDVRDITLAVNYNIILTVPSLKWLETSLPVLETSQVTLRFHLKLDTGMGRIGVREREELKTLLEVVKASPYLSLEGVFTHFATADSENEDYFNHQVTRFKQLLECFEELPQHVHCANSATAIWHDDLPTTIIRYGIGMYGLNPSGTSLSLPHPLLPALKLETELVHVKQVQEKTSISYGATYSAKPGDWIGTLPIGYADGWVRAMQGYIVMIDNQPCEIIGRVCMDQCMVKLPYYLPEGTAVSLINSEVSERISPTAIAEHLGTINYEVLCLLSERIPRVYQ